MKLQYKTLKGLLRASENHFTLDNYKSNRIHHIKKGWVDIKITKELQKEIINLFVGVIGGKNQNRISENLELYNYKSLGIYSRLWIDKKKGYCVYCAGQDYPSEIKFIRRSLI